MASGSGAAVSAAPVVVVVAAAPVVVVVAAAPPVVAVAATATLVPIISSALSRASDSKIVSRCRAHLQQQREVKKGVEGDMNEKCVVATSGITINPATAATTTNVTVKLLPRSAPSLLRGSKRACSRGSRRRKRGG